MVYKTIALPLSYAGKKRAILQDGADGGGRTHTSSRILDFESSASANSATSATKMINNLRLFLSQYPGRVLVK